MKKSKINTKLMLKRKIQISTIIAGVLLGAALIFNWHLIRPEENKDTEIVQEDNKQLSVDPSQVCMVNDTYMAKPQIPVPIKGKTYYGCCQGCVETLNKESSTRNSIDPFSGKPVDKSEAFIVLLNQRGKVAYFESKDNYMAYTQGE